MIFLIDGQKIEKLKQKGNNGGTRKIKSIIYSNKER